jgi:hypothetical protein
MLRRTYPALYWSTIRRVFKGPVNGYELAELPSEEVLDEFLTFYRDKLVVTVVHNGLNSEAQHVVTRESDPLMSHFIAQLNSRNYGNPAEVKFALVPIQQAAQFVDKHKILCVPTMCLFHEKQLVQKVVGHRHRELSTKCLFFLRNHGRNIFCSV